MARTKWSLLMLCLLLAAGYIKFFCKTYTNTAVAGSADMIIALDVKRISNTIIWNFISTPSEWKIGNIFSSKEKETSWKDMVSLPDYIFAFHLPAQPLSTWYAVLPVKADDTFNNGLQRYGFIKVGTNDYVSRQNHVRIYRQENKVLVTNAFDISDSLFAIVKNEVFAEKNYVAGERLAKIVKMKSHLAAEIIAGEFFKGGALLTANFDKEKITVNGEFSPAKRFVFTNHIFSYSATALCALGFTQPSPALYNFFSDSAKKKFSEIINLNTDTLFQHGNKWYSLSVAGVQQRPDSAITYSYDDDFNKIENVVVNNVQEPILQFCIGSDSAKKLFTDWQYNNVLRQEEHGFLFTPMPFVKSYGNLSGDTLKISSANYYPGNDDAKINCVFFLRLLFTQLPPGLQAYLPDYLGNAMSNLEYMEASAVENGSAVSVSCIISKKKNDKPLMKF